MIECKAREEKKAWALIDAGYDSSITGDAYTSIFFQNANNSVRVTDAFMKAVADDDPWETLSVTGEQRVVKTYQARDLMRRIAEAAHVCGDPGMQFDTTVNEWHTCPRTDRIRASNPCFVGETEVLTSEGRIRIKRLAEMSAAGKNLPLAITHDPEGRTPVLRRIKRAWESKTTSTLVEVQTDKGITVRCTPEHKFYLHDGRGIAASDLEPGQSLRKIGLHRHSTGRMSISCAGGSELLARWLWSQQHGAISEGHHIHHRNEIIDDDRLSNLESLPALEHWSEHSTGARNVKFLGTPVETLLAVWKAIEAARPGWPVTVARWNLFVKRQGLKGQVPLSNPRRGIRGMTWAKFTSWIAEIRQEMPEVKPLQTDGSPYETAVGASPEQLLAVWEELQKKNPVTWGRWNYHVKTRGLSGKIPQFGKSGWAAFAQRMEEGISLANDRVASIRKITVKPVPVFDLEVEGVHRFAVSSEDALHGLVVSNCSEYMFLDDSACNLASINLMKFEDPEHGFDTEAFTAAVRTIITAQEIMVGNASYPTPAIERNSHDYRPLGLGYCNLGAFLMSQALPYDSDDGRTAAGAITALMTGAAYEQSAIIARDAGGPFHGFERNREPFLKVMKKHAGAVRLIESGSHKPSERIAAAATRAWQAAIGIGSEHGFRNAQATVLAPTGCLVGSTLVSTSKGLVRLSTLGDPSGDQWQDTDFMVDAGDGPRRATKFFANGRKPIHRIVTKSGYTLRGTPDHKVKIVSSEGEWVWRTLADVHPDDQLPLRLGMAMDRPNEVDLPPSPTDLHHNVTKEFTTPRSMTPELAEFAGFFMGNGSLHTKGLRLAVYGLDTDVINHLTKLAKTLFGLTARPEECGSYVSLNLNSVPLTAWWASCAFDKISTKPGKGKCPRLPDAVLASNNISVYTGFIRGLYEADGTSASGYPSWSSARLSFAEDVQTLLLALGYPSRRRQYESGLGSTIQEVRLLNTAYAERFMAEIGFIGARKTAAVEAVERAGQTPRQDRIPLPRRLVDQLTSPGEETGIRKMLLHGLRKKGSVPRPTLTELRRLSDPLVPGTKELDSLLGFFYEKVVLSVPAGEAETFDLSVPENVTYVANGFVSHNTIGFMMDCDTTGVEPDIALVKYKKLVNQGLMKIVNQTVPKALKRLCYDEKTARAILEHIETGGTIENAPGFAEEDLDIFDCAFKPQNGERSIAPSGHIRMIGAVQPFISGAISKTINMPTDTTVDEIERTYIDAWRQGAKSVSIYRDGSKRSQPLTTGEDEEKTGTEEHPKPSRRRLADERRSITHKFEVGGHEGYVTVGIYKDGTPGEIFIVMAKEGSTISGFADAFAQAISYALQYGVPLEMLVNKFCHQRFEPAGMTRNPKIRMAKSIVDYIVRWMATKFLDEDAQRAIGINLPEKPTTDDGPAGAAPTGTPESAPGETAHPMAMIAAHLLPNDQDAPPCPACGSIMLRNGTCYACPNCGTTSGCS